MNDNYRFFIERVWPQVSRELKAHIYERYPNIRVGAEPCCQPLPKLAVCMVVGLTGTGKTTALRHLADLRQARTLRYHDDIPTRRELADLVIIPTAQVLSGDRVQPVTDREQRFACTYKFAHEFESGGSAAAYGWLHYCGDKETVLLSDGLRGPGEIAYALAHYPHWSVVELWVDPLTRLQRLTERSDSFDRVASVQTAVDLSFLNADQQRAAQQALAQGIVSHQAVVTARAESQNYGLEPFDRANATPRYRCLVIDELAPQDVAHQIGLALEAR